MTRALASLDFLSGPHQPGTRMGREPIGHGTSPGGCSLEVG